MELLHFENGDRIIADIYDDNIVLKLIILKGREIVIHDDTKLFLLGLCTNYFLDKKKMELDVSLKNVNLGILLNIYYYRIANDIKLDKELFALNANGDWIGTGYCCFENDNIATWIYFTNDRFVFKCTPLYEGLFDDCVLTFKEFIKDYKEYQNNFTCQAYRKFMHNLKKIILSKEWLDKTKNEIERAAKQGDKSAQTAWKFFE